MFSFKRSLLVLVALLALCGTEARADSFVIPNVGGFLFVVTFDDAGPPTLLLPPAFNLFGPGLTVSTPPPFATSGDVGNVQARDICRSIACVPGTMIGTNSTFAGTLAGGFGAFAIVNGVTYLNVNVTGSLNFISSPIVLPNFGSAGQVTLPFSFSGEITGDSLQPGAVNPIFTATLGGQGLATFRFLDVNRNPANPRYMLEEVDYQFQPVPEPAALLLLSSGLAGLVAAARRRQKLVRKDS